MSPSLTTLAAHLSQQQFGNPELFSLALADSNHLFGDGRVSLRAPL